MQVSDFLAPRKRKAPKDWWCFPPPVAPGPKPEARPAASAPAGRSPSGSVATRRGRPLSAASAPPVAAARRARPPPVEIIPEPSAAEPSVTEEPFSAGRSRRRRSNETVAAGAQDVGARSAGESRDEPLPPTGREHPPAGGGDDPGADNLADEPPPRRRRLSDIYNDEPPVAGAGVAEERPSGDFSAEIARSPIGPASNRFDSDAPEAASAASTPTAKKGGLEGTLAAAGELPVPTAPSAEAADDFLDGPTPIRRSRRFASISPGSGPAAEEIVLLGKSQAGEIRSGGRAEHLIPEKKLRVQRCGVCHTCQNKHLKKVNIHCRPP